MEEKELIQYFIGSTKKLGCFDVLDFILGKCYRYSDVSTLLNRAQTDYYILGRGVIFLKDGLIENIDLSFLENISTYFIEISNEKQFEEFKKLLEIEVQKKISVKEQKKYDKEEIIMTTIIREVPNETEENKEKLLELVKSAEGKNKDDLLEIMDTAYKIVRAQGKVTEIFMSNPELKVSKNTYNRKNRKKVI